MKLSSTVFPALLISDILFDICLRISVIIAVDASPINAIFTVFLIPKTIWSTISNAASLTFGNVSSIFFNALSNNSEIASVAKETLSFIPSAKASTIDPPPFLNSGIELVIT